MLDITTLRDARRKTRPACAAIAALLLGLTRAASQSPSLPSFPLAFGAFTARFSADGAFTLQGEGWPSFTGAWKLDGERLEITSNGPPGCSQSGRYRVRLDGGLVAIEVDSDACEPRRMILGHSTWRRAGEAERVAPRHIERTAAAPKPASLPPPSAAAGSWPSFRGPQASGVADGQRLPDRWDGKTGENILWHIAVPGLAHSSPVIWGDRLFITTAVSGDPHASFRPGLYGDGDASEDRTRHRWMIRAIDKHTGKTLWEQAAYEGAPIDKRHIKSTYASATPVTDGRIVVAWFGSQGVYAYDMRGALLWTVNLGRIDIGAYDIPSYEWGPASSPIIWNNLVILQCDTQADSFLLALNALTGETVWKTERTELPSWGTPTVAMTDAGPQLVTNAPNFVRAYDPRTGQELWRIGPSSKITAPTPIFGEGLFVVASGRAPERPIFVVRPAARGDLTLGKGETSSASVAWSRTGRGPYMPTPLIYNGLLYVLANNGIFDAYNLRTGEEVYRERLPNVGSGFSASPVAADGKIYLSSEDGDMLVATAGPTFTRLATNAMGDLLMATPALSDGVMYVRSAGALFAIREKK